MKRSVAALLWVSALAAGACGIVSGQPAFAETASWPTKPIRAILPIAPGTGADVISRIVLNQLSVQLAHPIVIENKGGAGGTHRRSDGGQGRARRLHAAVAFRDACHRARALHQPVLRHRNRLCRGDPARKRAERAGGLAVEGHQDGAGPGRRRQGQARHADLCLRGRRLDHAPDGGALPDQRRHPGDPRAVPRRRVPARDRRRPRRLRLFADRDLAAEHPRRQPARRRRERPEARLRAARCADHAGGGLSPTPTT